MGFLKSLTGSLGKVIKGITKATVAPLKLAHKATVGTVKMGHGVAMAPLRKKKGPLTDFAGKMGKMKRNNSEGY